MYVSSRTFLNEDFLNQVFANQKKLLQRADVRTCSVPYYDKLSVKNMLSVILAYQMLSQYFANDLSSGKLTDRVYTFIMLNTVWPDYTEEIIKHAHNQRYSTEDYSKV